MEDTMVKKIDVVGVKWTPIRVVYVPFGEKSENFPSQFEESNKDGRVEFYDMRYPQTPDGQFISSYYVSTLIEKDDSGLDLHGGEPEWKIDYSTMRLVRDFLIYHYEKS